MGRAQRPLRRGVQRGSTAAGILRRYFSYVFWHQLAFSSGILAFIYAGSIKLHN